ncbi:MAG: hypothetical protein HDR38_05820 [Treponema sp.]|nr:hypothetical protein [Treponema sp.]
MKKTNETTANRVYSEDEKKHLETVKDAFKTAYNELINDPKLEVTPYSDHNAIINLTKAIANGVDIYMPAVNRTHGRDQKRTGESIRQDGAQSLLLVVPVSVAKAAGMELCRFKNDKKTEPIGESGLVCINGNGRGDYTIGLDEEDRPTLYATLIEPNCDGYYDLPGAMAAINEHISPWKTQDKMTKQIMEMGTNVNPYLMKTRQLINAGYNYQAACQLTTLRPDRITSAELTEGKWDEIFKYAKEAERVRVSLETKFNGNKRVLKNKPLSQKICKIFELLLKEERNNATSACNILIEFIEGIDLAQVDKIVGCKKDKDNPINTADTKRVEIINNLFNRFVGKKGLKID